MTTQGLVPVLTIAGAVALGACGSQQPDRITGGAAAGALTGAAVGALAGGVGVIPGVLIGGAAGGGTAAVTGPETVDFGPPIWR